MTRQEHLQTAVTEAMWSYDTEIGSELAEYVLAHCQQLPETKAALFRLPYVEGEPPHRQIGAWLLATCNPPYKTGDMDMPMDDISLNEQFAIAIQTTPAALGSISESELQALPRTTPSRPSQMREIHEPFPFGNHGHAWHMSPDGNISAI